MKRKLLVSAALSLAFLARAVFFAGSAGGIEHDSGWYLGLARNLAERGIYASYTNTLIPTSAGAFVGIHGRPSVQDKDGFTYFPAGVTVGPGYVVPEALLIKIFGQGQWVYRSWPLLAYFGMIFCLFFLAFEWGGMLATVPLFVWLWMVPHFHLQLSFESFGEPIALFFTLLSLSVFDRRARKRALWFFSGLLLGVAIQTKTLMALGLPAFLALASLELIFLRQRKDFLARLKLWAYWVSGCVLPTYFFLAYQAQVLVPRFGWVGWQAVRADSEMVFQQNGSGLTQLGQLPIEFILLKLKVWADAGFSSALIWILVLAVSFEIVRQWRIKPDSFRLGALISASFLAWFLLLSPTGWTRHVWPGLVLAIVLISVQLTQWIFRATEKGRNGKLAAAVGVLAMLWALKPYRMDISPKLTADSALQWNKQSLERGIIGMPSSPIFPLQEQRELESFFREKVGLAQPVYYHLTFLVSEMSSITGRVFFPLGRSAIAREKKGLLIFGPYQMGSWPWQIVDPDYFARTSSKWCSKMLFKSRSYAVCELRI